MLGKSDSIPCFKLWFPPLSPVFFFTACCIHYLRAQSVLSLCLWTLPQFVLSFQLEFNWRQWISWRQWGEVQVLLETLAPADDLSELQHHVSMPTESTRKGAEGTVAGKKKYQEFFFICLLEGSLQGQWKFTSKYGVRHLGTWLSGQCWFNDWFQWS